MTEQKMETFTLEAPQGVKFDFADNIQTDTVSYNDVSSGNGYSVSVGDAAIIVDEPTLLSEMNTLNQTCAALLFFTIFTWVEIRLRQAVKGGLERWKK